MKNVSLIFVLTFTALSSLGSSNLKVVAGRSSHNPDEGIPPQTLTKLIALAHERAIDKLGNNRDDFIQISPWHDEIDCKPVYRGSPDCYSASIQSKASFILKQNYEDVWQVDTEGFEPYASTAYQEALREAQLACNGQVVLPPTNVTTREIEDAGERGHYWTLYKATFQCIK